MKPKEFVDALDDERIVAAIREAEGRTRAEIRVHVTTRPVEDAKRVGALVFEKLGMTATAERNGVLIFLAPASRSFAVLGDSGIHERCGDEFWSRVAAAMSAHFREGRFDDGLRRRDRRRRLRAGAPLPAARGRRRPQRAARHGQPGRVR